MAEDLLADAKERAEHVILVDLGRNDLGRVCQYGSVRVEDFMAIENYSHVMHIRLERTGTLRPASGRSTRCARCSRRARCPGPRRSAPCRSSTSSSPSSAAATAGAIGWVSYTGDLDTCIHIRTVVVKDGVAHVQAGGGTVADAKPDYEFRESEAKAKAVMQAIALAVAQPDWP